MTVISGAAGVCNVSGSGLRRREEEERGVAVSGREAIVDDTTICRDRVVAIVAEEYDGSQSGEDGESDRGGDVAGEDSGREEGADAACGCDETTITVEQTVAAAICSAAATTTISVTTESSDAAEKGANREKVVHRENVHAGQGEVG